MIKFVIWGIGNNGKYLSEFIDKESIVAFIDQFSNLKEYDGIPVIGYSDYKQMFLKYPIIISIEQYQSVVKILEDDNILYYIYCKELYETQKILCQIDYNSLIKKYVSKTKVGIKYKGLTSVLLYNRLEAIGIDSTFEIYSSDKNLMWLQENQSIRVSKEETNLLDVDSILHDNALCEHPELEKFRNIHGNSRCFIVATGPSLCISDLDKLYAHKEICISVNGIFKGFDMTNWRPDYYIISDPNGVIQWKNDILNMNVKEKFIADTCYFFNREDVPDNIHKWHMEPLKHKGTKPLFSEDFSKVSYNGDTITYDGALQLATYLGFKEIYLVGTDCSQPVNGKQHFVENYQDKAHEKAEQHPELQTISYMSAKEYAENHGIKIYNATRGGCLEVFERVDFDTLF